MNYERARGKNNPELSKKKLFGASEQKESQITSIEITPFKAGGKDTKYFTYRIYW